MLTVLNLDLANARCKSLLSLMLILKLLKTKSWARISYNMVTPVLKKMYCIFRFFRTGMAYLHILYFETTEDHPCILCFEDPSEHVSAPIIKLIACVYISLQCKLIYRKTHANSLINATNIVYWRGSLFQLSQNTKKADSPSGSTGTI